MYKEPPYKYMEGPHPLISGDQLDMHNVWPISLVTKPFTRRFTVQPNHLHLRVCHISVHFLRILLADRVQQAHAGWTG